jgi:hypothetical protein
MGSYLLVGVPRSGTSWVGEALSLGHGAKYLDEPDGFRDAFPFRVMMRYGESPILAPGDAAPDYERMWNGILSGGRPPRDPRGRLGQFAFEQAGTEARRRARAGTGTSLWLQVAEQTAQPARTDPDARDVFVTSVQCVGALDWIAQRFSPRVIVLFRSLLNTVASWHEMTYMHNPKESATLAAFAQRAWGVDPPAPDAPLVAQRAFVVAVQFGLLRSAIARHPEWVVASHEELCGDASVRLRALAAAVGLDWSDAADDFVRASNEESDEPWGTKRLTHLQPERWRDRLGAEDVDAIREVVDRFPDRAGIAI